MADRLQHMIDAEIRNGYSYDGAYLKVYDAWKHLNNGFLADYDDDVEIFRGIKNGKRNTEVQASLFDAIHAEVLDERNAEKARVRNRRRADRKHNVLPKVRKQMRYDRGWNRYLSMPCYGCKNIGIAEYRMDNAEQVARKDWEKDLSMLTEEIECAEFMLETDLDDLAWLKNEIFEIGNPEGTIALYEERIKELRKESERKARLEQYKVDTEKRIRNGEEYLRKNKHIREMI